MAPLLKGVRVLDLSSIVAGPTASMILSDLGADILKVERVGGEDGRAMGPHRGKWGAYFVALNRGKRSITLDLGKPEGREVVLRLAAGCDVFLENFRGGKAAALGLDEAAIRARKPDIIYASLSAYGPSGPDYTKPGYDAVLQARTGIMSVTGTGEGHPMRTGVSILDVTTGTWMALGILAALLERQRSGKGQRVDASLFQTGLLFMSYHLVYRQFAGVDPQPQGARHKAFAPYGSLPTGDGQIMLGISSDKAFHRLCAALGHEEWSRDARFRSNTGRVNNVDELENLIAGVLRTQPTAHWVALFDEHDIANDPIQSPSQVLADPQAAALDAFAEINLTGESPFLLPRLPIGLSVTQPTPQGPPPATGEHGRAILLEAGFSAAEIDDISQLRGVRGGRRAAVKALSEEQELILRTVRQFVDKEVIPVASAMEHRDEYPHALVAQMKEMGLFGLNIPEEYGGAGVDTTTFAMIFEEISRGWLGLAGVIGSNSVMCDVVARFGTEEQKRRFLPAMATGEKRGGICLTESNAGTDLQAIATTATRDGDTYRVDGSKMWITNARHGDTFLLLAKTDPAAQPAHRGMSAFVIEKGAPGMTVSRDIEKMGYKGVETCELHFSGFPVPAANLIGGLEGQGFKQVMTGLEAERLNVAARGLGIARAAFEEAIKYAQRRRTFGKPIAEYQTIQNKLADMATHIEASRLLIYSACEKRDRGERCDLEAGMAKLFATETAAEVSFEAMRIMGANGYSKDFPVERYYRDAPLVVIGGGTNELQRLIIARNLLKKYKEDA